MAPSRPKHALLSRRASLALLGILVISEASDSHVKAASALNAANTETSLCRASDSANTGSYAPSTSTLFILLGTATILAAAAGAVVAAESTISITTQQRIQVGDAVKFQWQGGKPPYTLKVLLNNSVVAQNEGWTGTSVQWRATPEQVPAGTAVKIRITDSRGEMVLSDATKVVATDSGGGSGKSNEEKGDQSEEEQQGHHEYQHGDDGDASLGNAQHMDDPTESDRYQAGTNDDLEALPATPSRRPSTQIGAADLSTQAATGQVPAGLGTSPAADAASDGFGSVSAPMPTGIDHGGAAAMPSAADAMPSASSAAGISAAAGSADGAVPTSDGGLSSLSDASPTSAAATSASDTSAAGATSSAVTDPAESSSSGSSNKTLYIGIGVIVLVLVGAGVAFFFWRRNKQQREEEAEEKAASRKRKGKGKASTRRGTAGSTGTDSQGDDEEKLVGGSDDDHDAYGSEASDEEAAQSSSKKGSTRSGGRGTQAYHDDDDSGSEALKSDSQVPARRPKGTR